MATNLSDILFTLTDDEIRDRIKDGFNVTVLKTELKRRKVPLRKPRDPNAVKVKGKPSFRADRPPRMTGGRVELVGFCKLPRKNPLPGRAIEPWNAHAR